MVAIQRTKPNGDIIIRGAAQDPHPAAPSGVVWKVSVLVEESVFLHCFPLDTMEWRSAEYAIDPNDRDTLLDLVLAEPWMIDGIDPQEHPSGLFNAETIDEARDFQLGRVTMVKDDHGLYSAPEKDRVLLRNQSNDPRHYIRDASHIDHRLVVAKREIVGIERDRVRSKREKKLEAARVAESVGLNLGNSSEPMMPDGNADKRLEHLNKTLQGMRSYGNRDN